MASNSNIAMIIVIVLFLALIIGVVVWLFFFSDEDNGDTGGGFTAVQTETINTGAVVNPPGNGEDLGLNITGTLTRAVPSSRILQVTMSRSGETFYPGSTTFSYFYESNGINILFHNVRFYEEDDDDILRTIYTITIFYI